MFTFWCPKCGNEMKAREEYAGRTARCPKCNESVVIPGAQDAGARPAANSSGISRPARTTPDRRRVVLIAALLLLGLAGGLAWWLLGRPGGGNRFREVNDLALVPANAQAVFCLKPSLLWQHPVVRKALGEARLNPDAADPVQRFQDETGLLPEDIERVCFVVKSVADKERWAVVKTVRPYDVQVLQGHLHDVSPESHLGEPFITGQTGDGRTVSVAFVSPQVIVLGEAEGVRGALELLRRPITEGPLASTLALIGKEYGGVFGYNPRVAAPEGTRAGFDLSMLDKAELIQGTMQLDKRCRVQASARMPAEKDAEDLRKRLNLWKQVATVGLLFRGGEQGQQLLSLLNAVKFDVKDKEVVGSVEADPDVVAPLLLKALEKR